MKTKKEIELVDGQQYQWDGKTKNIQKRLVDEPHVVTLVKHDDADNLSCSIRAKDGLTWWVNKDTLTPIGE